MFPSPIADFPAVLRLGYGHQHAALATIPSTIQPRRTPGLVMPSLQNGPLPRLKPQPLHISMLIHRRQESRDRRTVQQKAWQEMLFHLRKEASFLDQMETDAADEREMGEHSQCRYIPTRRFGS